LLALAACGRLNDEAYVGDPRYVVDLTVEGLAPRTAGAPLYATLAWIRGNRLPPNGVPGSDIDPIEFPAHYPLRVFGLPPRDAVDDHAGDDTGARGAVAGAAIEVFEDVVEDGEYSGEADDTGLTDVTVGESGWRVYHADGVNDLLRERMRADRYPFVNPEALTDGFHLARPVEQPDAPPLFELVPDQTVVIRPVPVDEGAGRHEQRSRGRAVRWTDTTAKIVLGCHLPASRSR
jgi:hypothetical protein